MAITQASQAGDRWKQSTDQVSASQFEDDFAQGRSKAISSLESIGGVTVGPRTRQRMQNVPAGVGESWKAGVSRVSASEFTESWTRGLAK